MINIVPVSIYIICLIVNTLGIHFVARIEKSRHNIIRIAPVCNGRLLLSLKNPTSQVWDIPIERNLEGTFDDSKKYAMKTAKRISGTNVQPRFILQYTEECSCGICNHVLLFILPIKTESDIKLDGRFFNFEEIENNLQQIDPCIKKELEHLRNAASLWKEFYL